MAVIEDRVLPKERTDITHSDCVEFVEPEDIVVERIGRGRKRRIRNGDASATEDRIRNLDVLLIVPGAAGKSLVVFLREANAHRITGYRIVTGDEVLGRLNRQENTVVGVGRSVEKRILKGDALTVLFLESGYAIVSGKGIDRAAVAFIAEESAVLFAREFCSFMRGSSPPRGKRRRRQRETSAAFTYSRPWCLRAGLVGALTIAVS